MNLDEMVNAWRSQEKVPLYGVNRDLLQLVMKHEQADLRRALWREKWTVYGCSAFLVGFLACLFVLIYSDDDPRSGWDYAVTGLGTGAALLWAGALSVSRRRLTLRERDFGNTLLAEVQRNLSLVEYQLSHAGHWQRSVLAFAPMMAATTAIYWLIIQINNNPFGWFDVSMIAFILLSTVWSAFFEARRAAEPLRPQAVRLRKLRDILRAAE